jgi:hypothetical protein
MIELSGRLLVDMDNTLYAAPFAEAARVMWGVDAPPSSEVGSWLWYKDYLTKEQWRTCINLVHNRQGFYLPFPRAVMIMRMAEDTFHITVTSQRPATGKPAVDWWLATNKIPAHRTVITDKSKQSLFKEGDIVIDDAPHNIVHALQRGAHVITLSYPYNKHTEALGARHAKDWEMIGEIMEGLIADDYPE